MDDTLNKEKHEDIILPDFYSGITSQRSNQDLIKNKYGTKLVEYCIATGSYIANGRTIGDFQGKFTCHEKNGSSTVDYAVISESLHSLVRKFQVLDFSVGSDHCPIVLDIDLKQERDTTDDGVTDRLPPIPWNERTKMLFLNRINTEEIQQPSSEMPLADFRLIGAHW